MNRRRDFHHRAGWAQQPDGSSAATQTHPHRIPLPPPSACTADDATDPALAGSSSTEALQRTCEIMARLLPLLRQLKARLPPAAIRTVPTEPSSPLG